MPRDANGNYTNANDPVNAGETILASTYNTENDDKATELTDSLSRSGKGAMLSQLKAIDGVIGAPGLSFGTELSSGLYRATQGDVRLSSEGNDVFRVNPTTRQLEIWNALLSEWFPVPQRNYLTGAQYGLDNKGTVGSDANNTSRLLQAMSDAQNQRKVLVIDAGIYRFNEILYETVSSTLPLVMIGAGGLSTIFQFRQASANGGLRLYADTPPARTKGFVNMLLQGFGLDNNSTTPFIGAGLDIYGMSVSVIRDIRGRNWNYGCKIRSSWNNVFEGKCDFSDNEVGIKSPPDGGVSSPDRNEGVNATLFSGIDLSNNRKAGGSFSQCNNLTFDNALLESNPVGIYLRESFFRIALNELYYEAGSVTPTENDRKGNPTTYLIYIGKDEDGVGASSGANVTLRNGMSRAGEGKYYVSNCSGFYCDDQERGRGYIVVGDNARDIHINSLAADSRFVNMVVPGVARAASNHVFREIPYNLITNGNFMFNQLPFATFTAAPSGTASASLDTAQTLAGNPTRSLALLCPDGATTITMQFVILVGNDYRYGNALPVSAGMHAKASSADISQAQIRVKDNNGAVISSDAISTGLTDWFVANCFANINQNILSATALVEVVVTRTTGTGDAYLYIDEIIACDSESPDLLSYDPVGIIAGNSGLVRCSTADGGQWSGEVSHGYRDTRYYQVIASCIRGTFSEVNFVISKTNTTFKIICDTQDADFAYLVLPQVASIP